MSRRFSQINADQMFDMLQLVDDSRRIQPTSQVDASVPHRQAEACRTFDLRLSAKICGSFVFCVATFGLLFLFTNKHPLLAAHVKKSDVAVWKFDFGPGAVANGYKQVTPQSIYSRESGFGFEPGSQIVCIDRSGKDPLRSDFCTSEKPFYFS
ncbi:MAG TPA: hypothetical protein VL866_19605, partial [Pyrinomonadaceae bacterium]|nr:hypothetical protein [Pyrinomonadaceae bacterium]